MSERVLRAQVEQFKYRKSRALQENLLRKNLFSTRPEIFSSSYRCEPVHDKAMGSVGMGVLLIPNSTRSAVDVICGTARGGRISSEGVGQLADAIKESGGMLDANITKVSQLTGSFEVRLSVEPSHCQKEGKSP